MTTLQQGNETIAEGEWPDGFVENIKKKACTFTIQNLREINHIVNVPNVVHMSQMNNIQGQLDEVKGILEEIRNRVMKYFNYSSILILFSF